SNSAIAPGTTTTEDLEWWFRDKVRSLGLTTWFQPAVSVQRPGGTARISFADHPGRIVIDRGDLVHVDFGIIYLGLHTDQQQHAYVLGDGETGVPSGLASALAEGNRLQDILLGQFAEGHTGNQALAAARAEALSEGLRPTIYSHPIGLHGHAAGPSIGLWDQQDGVPGDGDLPIRPATTWSIELNVQVDIEEWGGRTVSIMLEEDARFDGTAVEWLDGRQTAFHLVR
ncbi:M24 family metallopeptidase, partial [bacterium]|nr:M24 family metallopeptidase [bacterium]